MFKLNNVLIENVKTIKDFPEGLDQEIIQQLKTGINKIFQENNIKVKKIELDDIQMHDELYYEIWIDIVDFKNITIKVNSENYNIETLDFDIVGENINVNNEQYEYLFKVSYYLLNNEQIRNNLTLLFLKTFDENGESAINMK